MADSATAVDTPVNVPKPESKNADATTRAVFIGLGVLLQIETGNPERLACQRIGAVDHDPDRGTTHRTQAQAENVEG